ncbi:hypothetical protein Trydic_g5278 [Trypoxylus dichotomus]
MDGSVPSRIPFQRFSSPDLPVSVGRTYGTVRASDGRTCAGALEKREAWKRGEEHGVATRRFGLRPPATSVATCNGEQHFLNNVATSSVETPTRSGGEPCGVNEGLRAGGRAGVRNGGRNYRPAAGLPNRLPVVRVDVAGRCMKREQEDEEAKVEKEE